MSRAVTNQMISNIKINLNQFQVITLELSKIVWSHGCAQHFLIGRCVSSESPLKVPNSANSPAGTVKNVCRRLLNATDLREVQHFTSVVLREIKHTVWKFTPLCSSVTTQLFQSGCTVYVHFLHVKAVNTGLKVLFLLFFFLINRVRWLFYGQWKTKAWAYMLLL